MVWTIFNRDVKRIRSTVGNFRRVKIFADFADRLVSTKIKTMGHGHKLQEGEPHARAQINRGHKN